MKKKIYGILAILGIFLSGVVVNATVSWKAPLNFAPKGNEDTWILYFGSVLGSLIGGSIAGLVAFMVSKYQIKAQKENDNQSRIESLKKEIQRIEVQNISETAHKVFRGLCEELTGIENMIQMYMMIETLKDLEDMEPKPSEIFGRNFTTYTDSFREIILLQSQIQALLLGKKAIYSAHIIQLIGLLEKMTDHNRIIIEHIEPYLQTMRQVSRGKIEPGDINELIIRYNKQLLPLSKEIVAILERLIDEVFSDFMGDLFEKEIERAKRQQISLFFRFEPIPWQKVND